MPDRQCIEGSADDSNVRRVKRPDEAIEVADDHAPAIPRSLEPGQVDSSARPLRGYGHGSVRAGARVEADCSGGEVTPIGRRPALGDQYRIATRGLEERDKWFARKVRDQGRDASRATFSLREGPRMPQDSPSQRATRTWLAPEEYSCQATTAEPPTNFRSGA